MTSALIRRRKPGRPANRAMGKWKRSSQSGGHKPRNTEDDRPPPEAIGGKEESSPRSFRETADNLVSDF